MNRLAVFCASALVAGVGSLQPAEAAGPSEVLTQKAWLGWVTDRARSFDHANATSSLAIEIRVDAAEQFDLRGVLNADGSLAVTITSAEVEFRLRCVDTQSCWARQLSGGSDGLWHRISAEELSGLRSAAPDVDGFLAPGAECSVDGTTASLVYGEEGTSVRVSVAFSEGAFRLSERLVDPDQHVDLTVTKSLTRTTRVRVKGPRVGMVGAPMVKDVVPQLP